jgi:predicted permease
MHIMNVDLYKLKLKSKYVSPTFDDTYYAINFRHLQAAFYLLMPGYVLAVACLVSEIMWHRYCSKGRGPTSTSVTDRHT